MVDLWKIFPSTYQNLSWCHVGFYKKEKYKNNYYSSSWLLFPSPLFIHLPAWLLSLTNSHSNIPPSTGILNNTCEAHRKESLPARWLHPSSKFLHGPEAILAQCWGRIFDPKALPSSTHLSLLWSNCRNNLFPKEVRQISRTLLLCPPFRGLRKGEDQIRGQLLGGWNRARDL